MALTVKGLMFNGSTRSPCWVRLRFLHRAEMLFKQSAARDYAVCFNVLRSALRLLRWRSTLLYNW